MKLRIRKLYLTLMWKWEHYNEMRKHKQKYTKVLTLTELNRIKRKKDFFEITGWKI